MAWWTRTKGWLAELPRWQEMINRDPGGAIEQGLPFLTQEIGNAALSGLEGMAEGTSIPAMLRGDVPFSWDRFISFDPNLAANAINRRRESPFIDYFSMPDTEGGQGVLYGAQWAEQPLEALAQGAAEGVFEITENPALSATTLAAGGIVPIPGRGRGKGKGFLTLEDINAAAPANRPPMVSRLEVDLDKAQAKQTPQQWAKWAEKSGNLYEANERGLVDWLNEQEGTVSREQVEGYLAEEGQLVPAESVLADAGYGQATIRDAANQNLRLVEDPDAQMGLADGAVRVIGGNGEPVGSIDFLVDRDGLIDGYSGTVGGVEVERSDTGWNTGIRYGEPGWEVALREQIAERLATKTDIELPDMGLSPLEGTRPRALPAQGALAEAPATTGGDVVYGDIETTDGGGPPGDLSFSQRATLPDGSVVAAELYRDDNGDHQMWITLNGQRLNDFALDEDVDVGDTFNWTEMESREYLTGQLEEAVNDQMQLLNEGAEGGGRAVAPTQGAPNWLPEVDESGEVPLDIDNPGFSVERGIIDALPQRAQEFMSGWREGLVSEGPEGYTPDRGFYEELNNALSEAGMDTDAFLAQQGFTAIYDSDGLLSELPINMADENASLETGTTLPAIPNNATRIDTYSYMVPDEPMTEGGDAFIMRNPAGDEVFVDVEYEDMTPQLAQAMNLPEESIGTNINIRTYDTNGDLIEWFGPLDTARLNMNNLEELGRRLTQDELADLALDIRDDGTYNWTRSEAEAGGQATMPRQADLETYTFSRGEDFEGTDRATEQVSMYSADNSGWWVSDLAPNPFYAGRSVYTRSPDGIQSAWEFNPDSGLVERYTFMGDEDGWYVDDEYDPGLGEMWDEAEGQAAIYDVIANEIGGDLSGSQWRSMVESGGEVPQRAAGRGTPESARLSQWDVPMVPKSPSPQHAGHSRNVREGYGERAVIQQGDPFWSDRSHLTMPKNPRTGQPLAEGMLAMSREGWGPSIEGNRMWLADEIQSPRQKRGGQEGWWDDPTSIVEQALLDIRDREDVSQLPINDRAMIEDVERRIQNRVPPTPGRTGGKWVEQQLAQGLGEAVSRGADYFGWNTAANMNDRWRTEGNLFEKIYDKAGPKSKIFRRLGLKPERITASDGNQYWAIRLTPEIKDRLIREGIPYYALGGMAILGAAGEDEEGALAEAM